MSEHNTNVEKIKNNAANLVVVAAFYLGYAFFEGSIAYDAILLVILGFIIPKWKSRIASVLALVFGIISLYYLLAGSNIDGFRAFAALAIIWSGALCSFYTFKISSVDNRAKGI